MLRSPLEWQSRRNPVMLAARIVADVLIPKGGKLGGRVLGCMALYVGTVENHLRLFVAKQLRRELGHALRRYVDRTGQMGVLKMRGSREIVFITSH